jgi:uncharacterized protein (DUF1501 family)
MMNIAELAGKDSFSRRYFMERTAQFTLGVSMSSLLPTLARAQAGKKDTGKAQNLIYIYLSGGMTHLDTFDPKESSSVALPNADPISTNVSGMRFGSTLVNLAKHADKMAVINSMSSQNGAHEQGQYIMRTAYDKRATIVHPTMGPFLEELQGKRGEILPDSVVIGQSTSNAGYLDPSRSPLPIADPNGGVPNSMLLTDETRFQRRMEMANKLGQQFVNKYDYSGAKSYVEYYDQATTLLKSTELQAFDISGESGRDKYGETRLGQGCLLARKLVENGVRTVEVISGGWDMHVGIDQSIRDKGKELDDALSALIEDLESKGLLDTTLIAVGTEFGRTPEVNMNSGRDHYPAAFSTALIGGGIKGGQVYGSTDKLGRKVKSDPVSPKDFIATIGYGMGVDLEETIYSPSGRPFQFGHDGEPVEKLFG